MVTIQDKGGDERSELLAFDLVGIFDLSYAFEHASLEQIQDFMLNGHPGRPSSPYYPSMIVSVDDERKKVAPNKVPFGIFFATKRANPDNSRPVMKTEGEIKKYRAKYPFLRFDENWMLWEDVKSLY